MEFLKEILGEELFNQFMEKINAHNGNEANKDNQIKPERIYVKCRQCSVF